jgi:predicted GH43/DUF377 family glycosyl hydrolase
VKTLKGINPNIDRRGVVMTPNGDPLEAEGVLNPASTRDRNGNLLLYPRVVEKGNISRVGIVRVHEDGENVRLERLGYALQPEVDYELRTIGGGKGCEDPRVTFIPVLDLYVMTYTAYGNEGPRIALATSKDAYNWDRLGVCSFPAELNLSKDDKDAAFFPEPVFSPKGVLSIAMYHRPMIDIPPIDDRGVVPGVLAQPVENRQHIRIAYVPLVDVLRDIKSLCAFTESVPVMFAGEDWGKLKLGGGSTPVRVKGGWLSVFHGVDPVAHDGGKKFTMRYSAGLVVHDAMQPHKVRYRSVQPVLQPETPDELSGTVNNVVFPTALEPRPDLGPNVFDMYYGMADYKIGLARLTLKRR